MQQITKDEISLKLKKENQKRKELFQEAQAVALLKNSQHMSALKHSFQRILFKYSTHTQMGAHTHTNTHTGMRLAADGEA